MCGCYEKVQNVRFPPLCNTDDTSAGGGRNFTDQHSFDFLLLPIPQFESFCIFTFVKRAERNEQGR